MRPKPLAEHHGGGGEPRSGASCGPHPRVWSHHHRFGTITEHGATTATLCSTNPERSHGNQARVIRCFPKLVACSTCTASRSGVIFAGTRRVHRGLWRLLPGRREETGRRGGPGRPPPVPGRHGAGKHEL
ncbi:unnamed protein product [Knipowitschia caucasica]